MALPAGFPAKTREEWWSILTSEDDKVRNYAQDLFRAKFTGPDKSKYIGKNPTVKLELIMELQGDETPGKAAPKSKAAAAPKEEAPKAAAKEAAKEAAAPKAAAAAPSQALKDIASLREEVSAIAEEVTGMQEMLADAHLMLRALVYANPSAMECIEDEDTRESLRGLVAPGNE